MLDVHAPHQSTHTWTDFFIHVGTIAVGLLLAIGLEQTVELFHHRHEVAETRRALSQRDLVAASLLACPDRSGTPVPKRNAHNGL